MTGTHFVVIAIAISCDHRVVIAVASARKILLIMLSDIRLAMTHTMIISFKDE